MSYLPFMIRDAFPEETENLEPIFLPYVQTTDISMHMAPDIEDVSIYLILQGTGAHGILTLPSDTSKVEGATPSQIETILKSIQDNTALQTFYEAVTDSITPADLTPEPNV